MEHTTIETLLRNLLGSGVDFLAPGAGQQLSNFIWPFIQSKLGISNDVFMQTVLTANQTPYGISRYMESQMAEDFGRRAMQQYQTDMQRMMYSGVARTLVSEAAYSNAPGNYGSYDNYDAYINGTVNQAMNNSIYNMLYNYVDPFDTRETVAMAGKAAANMTRKQLVLGNRNAFVESGSLVSKLFDGFDAVDFGGMRQSEVAAIAAAITKDTDYLSGTGGNADKLAAAGTKFKQSIQDISKAISGWKDIFGYDVPSMIKAVEDLSGQRFSQLSPARIRQITDQAVIGSFAGNYSLSELSAFSNQLSNAFSGMNMPDYARVQGIGYAANMVATAANGVLQPKYMTQRDWTQWNYKQASGMTASKGADLMTKAYALWLDKNPDGTADQFMSAIKRVSATGMSYIDAAMNLSGVSTYQSLDSAFGSANFDAAAQSNIGMLVGSEYNLQEAAKAGFISASRALSGITESDYNSVIAAMQKDPSLLSGDGVGTLNDQQAAILRYLKNSNSTFVKQLAQYSNLNTARQTAQREAQRQSYVENLHIPGNLAELVSSVFIDNGRGLQGGIRDIVARMTTNQSALFVGATDDALRDTAIAGYVGNSMFRGNTEAIKDLILYANGKGLGNSYFREAMNKLYDNANNDEAQKLLILARQIDAGSLDEYRAAGGNLTDLSNDSDIAKRQIITKRLQSKAAQYMKNYVLSESLLDVSATADKLKDQLKSNPNDPGLLGAIDAFNAANTGITVQKDSVLTDSLNSLADCIKAVINSINSSVQQLSTANGSTTPVPATSPGAGTQEVQ